MCTSFLSSSRRTAIVVTCVSKCTAIGIGDWAR
jgi:hypothetical protein